MSNPIVQAIKQICDEKLGDCIVMNVLGPIALYDSILGGPVAATDVFRSAVSRMAIKRHRSS